MSGIVVVSVMLVRSVLGSCLISCFFLSNSCLPRRSLIVSLYYTSEKMCSINGKERQWEAYDFKELTFHLIFPSLRLELVRNPKDLLNRSRYHTQRTLRLGSAIRTKKHRITNRNNSHYHLP